LQAFDYHRPQSLSEALELKRSSTDAKWLAGGMTLLPAMKLRLAAPRRLIDLAGLDELKRVSVDKRRVVLGSMAAHGVVARSREIRDSIPALTALAGGIADPLVRNRGTVGGSIANNDPAADYPAALLGLSATVRTSRRELGADEFFTGMFATALEEDELVQTVTFPKPERAAYMKFANPGSRYAIVGVFVAQTGSGVRVAVTGAGMCAYRISEMEQALGERFDPAALDEIDVSAATLNVDIHADADYRAHLIKVMARRATAAALAQ
jgi:carbon-monoxide dehydrogenase medium subunit